MSISLAKDLKRKCPTFYNSIRQNKLARNIVRYLSFKHTEKKLAQRRKAVQDYGYEVLDLVYQFGKEFDWPISIAWGTLLGFVRDGKLIEHDYDLDFISALPEDNKRKELIDYLKNNGCEWIRHAELRDTVITDSFDYKGVFFDFDYYIKDGNNLIIYSYFATNETLSEQKEGMIFNTGMEIIKYRQLSGKVIEASFNNGTMCFAPEDPEKQVEEYYGKEWRVPIKNFNPYQLDNYETLGFSREFSMWFKR